MFFPLLQKKKPIAPKIARPPMTAPTAMPALAPVDRPPPPDDWLGVSDSDAERLVLDGVLPEELGVGALKSSDVTLKQGTLMEKSIVSTKVWGGLVWHENSVQSPTE